MNHSSKEKTVPSATNTRDGIKTEINANDFVFNYTGHEAELSMVEKPNLARVAAEIAVYGAQAEPVAAALLTYLVAASNNERFNAMLKRVQVPQTGMCRVSYVPEGGSAAMTNQEAHEKYPNITKLVAFVDEQDRPTQLAALLLVIAAGLIKEAPL